MTMISITKSEKGVPMRTRLPLLAITAALSLALLLTGCGNGGASSDDTSFALGQQVPTMVLPAVIAEKHGLMADAGIDEVEYVNMPDPAAMFQAVEKGQIDAGVGVPAGLAAFNEQSGGDLVFFHAGLWLVNSFVAADDADIPPATETEWKPTVQAWKGRSIGVPALGGAIDKIVRAMVKEVGLSERDVDILAVGAGAASVASLEQGTVDVVLADPIALKELESKGLGQVILELGGPKGPSQYQEVLASGIYTTRDNVDDDKFDKFAEGWQAGVEFMNDEANKDAVIKDLMEFLNVDEGVAESFYAYRTQYDTSLDAETWDRTIDSYVDAGVMPEPKDRESLVADLD